MRPEQTPLAHTHTLAHSLTYKSARSNGVCMRVSVCECECVYLHVARLSQSFRFRLPLFIYDNICRDNLRLSIYARVCVCM